MGKRIIEKIREAGVVGAGGAGLPTHVKADAKVETVLVNGASCEPLLMSDPYLMEKEVSRVVRGLEALMDCTGAARGVICLKGKHASALRSVREAVASEGNGRLSAFELGDFYPAGDEHVLVHEVLGKTVPERGRAERFLRNAGVKEIVLTSSISGQGFDTLRSMLLF